MNLYNDKKPIKLKLNRDLVRFIKRGHPWVYADSLESRPKSQPGHLARLLDKKANHLAWGFYDESETLCFRVLSTQKEFSNGVVLSRFHAALNIRKNILSELNTAVRLFNGEGDGLAGLVCDLYGSTAVLQFDGPSPLAFWSPEAIAKWLVENTHIEEVYLKARRNSQNPSKWLISKQQSSQVHFLENGAHFVADIVEGQKTGFFIDQRENRQYVRRFSKDLRVLNLFSYTGGFSVYAGLGGASHVTSVDLSSPAIKDCQKNWEQNELSAKRHTAVPRDVLEFLEEAANQNEAWDLVIVDPPSFAPSNETKQKAIFNYTDLFQRAARRVHSGRHLVLSSCSSHITFTDFESIITEALSKASRKGRVHAIFGQPSDHPFPLACTELRYLKFYHLVLD